MPLEEGSVRECHFEVLADLVLIFLVGLEIPMLWLCCTGIYLLSLEFRTPLLDEDIHNVVRPKEYLVLHSPLPLGFLYLSPGQNNIWDDPRPENRFLGDPRSEHVFIEIS